MTDQTKGGPKTDAGKAVSRLNATKHGILAKEVLLTGEDAEELARMAETLRGELSPAGELERFLVDRIVTDMWRLRRALGVESANAERAKQEVEADDDFAELRWKTPELRRLAAQVAQLTDGNGERIARYVTSIERSMFRALHELQRLQAKRNGEDVLPPAIVDLQTDGDV